MSQFARIPAEPLLPSVKKNLVDQKMSAIAWSGIANRGVKMKNIKLYKKDVRSSRTKTAANILKITMTDLLRLNFQEKMSVLLE